MRVNPRSRAETVRRMGLQPSHAALLRSFGLGLAIAIAACATPPSSNPSVVDSVCAQQCSANLAMCSSGFKLFPVVQQKQCNDTYDVCISGCPPRIAAPSSPSSAPPPSAADRLKRLEELYQQGAISRAEYDAKRKEILSTL